MTSSDLNESSTLTGSGVTQLKEMGHGLRTADKLSRYSSHFDFLRRCLQNKLTPKGMHLSFGFSALPPSDALTNKIRRVLAATELNITRICMNFYRDQSKILRGQLHIIVQGWKANTDSSTFQSMLSTLRKKQRATATQSLKRKKKKLARLSHEKDSKPVQEPATVSKNRRFRRRRPDTTEEPAQVINISSVELSERQTRVLALGPKFCPTPTSYNEVALLEDTIEGIRRVRLREFFHEDDAPTQIPKTVKFYRKKFWCPPKGRDEALEAYSSTILSRIQAHVPQPPKRQNLGKSDRAALQDLRGMVRDRLIRISPADKGGAVVVQDFHKYTAEALRQLNNVRHYELLTANPTKEIAMKSNSLIHLLHDSDVIDDNCKNWGLIDPEKTKTHYFYHLPKVHKDADNPPGRPIVSGVDGPTERLSKLVDHWLQPLVQSLPSYVKDTSHLLKTLEEWKSRLTPIPDDALLVTIDVVALYTNIPHDEVATSLRSIMNSHNHLMTEGPSLQTLLQIVDHILQNNVLEFDGQVYRQVHGTAMGTPMAPSIANIFMGWLEHRLLLTSPWQFNHDLWRRYIDDILLLWTDGEEQLLLFLEWLNSQHSTIKFTANYGRASIPYLDVSITISSGDIVTDLHVKKTDASMYLPFSSCHPRHCMRGIPYGQCLRLRRLCSQEEIFQQRCQELQERLRKRGYPVTLVKSAIAKAARVPRRDTLDRVTRSKTSQRVPFVITHNPCNPPLASWLRDNMTTLHQSRRMQKAVPLPPVVGERNCRNLRSLLMPSKVPAPPPTSNSSQPARPPGCYKCSAKRCVICSEHLVEGDTFTSVRSRHSFKMRSAATCKTTNVIYLVDCARCADTQYVGETGNTLQKRFHSHRSDIRTGKDTLVARHFRGVNHCLGDLRCRVIEVMKSDGDQKRKHRERVWRHKLKTNYPFGLNVWD